MIDRRGVLAAGAALAGAALARPALAAEAAGAGLNALAERKGMRFGSAVAWSAPGADRGSFANPAYAALLERDCGLLVAENEMKWQWVRPSPDAFDFREFDAIAEYAASRNMALRGHNLFWIDAKWYPDWLKTYDFGPQPRQTAEAMLTKHVQTVCRRYGTRIHAYDVVNEAVERETGLLRETNVTRAIGGGDVLMDVMFHTARAEAPHAQLVYNDYMSWERSKKTDSHIAGVLKVLEGFRKRGTPVDALGVQSHIRLLKDKPVASLVREAERQWRRFLDEVTAMGYELVITEFDVNDKAAPDDVTLRDRAVADYAKAYFDLMFSYPQLRDVVAWGMCDRYTWLNEFDPRADKSIKRGTPYDDQFKPKPLHEAIAAAFRGAPERKTA